MAVGLSWGWGPHLHSVRALLDDGRRGAQLKFLRPRQKQELRPPMGPDAHVAVAAFQDLQQIAAHLASQPGGPEARLPAGHAVDRYSPALILLWTITESRRLRASAIS